MVNRFPHYRVIAKQKNQDIGCTLFDMVQSPIIYSLIGLFLGILIGKCLSHNK